MAVCLSRTVMSRNCCSCTDAHHHNSIESPVMLLPGVVGSLRSPRGYTSPRQLNEQISDLRIELARRDAEVEYLEAQLAEAVAANRPYARPQGNRSPDKASCNSELSSSFDEVPGGLALIQECEPYSSCTSCRTVCSAQNLGLHAPSAHRA